MKKARVEISADTKKAEKGMDDFTKSLKKHKVALLAAAAALAGIVKLAADFEKQMAEVSTLLDKETLPLMKDFEKGVRKMSVTFGQSTEVLAKGLFDIISAGVETSESLNVLEVAAKAATAGLTTTAVTADVLTTILNAYQLEAKEAASVSDLLFATALRGKTNFQLLAQNMGQVISTASIAGLSLEELGAGLSTITRAGISTAEAVTAYNQAILGFLGPTADSAKAAAEFGLVLSSNTLKTEGMEGALRRLETASAEQIKAIFPNVRAFKGLAALIGDLNGFLSDLELNFNRIGLTQDALEKNTDTLSHSLNRLVAAFKDAGIATASFFIKPLKLASDAITQLINDLTGLKTISIEGARLPPLPPGAPGLPGIIGGAIPFDMDSFVDSLIGKDPDPTAGLSIEDMTKALSELFEKEKAFVPPAFGGLDIDAPVGRFTKEMRDRIQRLQRTAPAFPDIPEIEDVKINLEKTEFILSDFSNTIVQTFGNTFSNILIDTRTFGDAMNDLWKRILSSIIGSLAEQGAAFGIKQLGGLFASIGIQALGTFVTGGTSAAAGAGSGIGLGPAPLPFSMAVGQAQSNLRTMG